MTGRRDLLKLAGAVAVYRMQEARMLGGVPGAAPSSRQLGLGFIGVGIRGSQLMQEFSQSPEARFVAACDLYDGYLRHAREVMGDSVVTTKRYEDILARKDIDAVVVATPDHWHRRITLDALSAGKHIYIEKPMTWSLKEGPEIIAAEKRSGKVLQVGSGTKTSTMTAKVKELIGQGAIGKVHQIRMLNHRNTREGAWVYPIPPDASPETIDWARFIGSAPKRPFSPEVFFRWRCWWEYSGGVATDLFVHLLTTLHEFMNVQAPVSVVSQGGLWFYKDGRTVPDVMDSIFEYKEGFLAQMCVNLKTTAPAPYAVIMGSDGTLVWDRNGLTHYKEAPDLDIQSYGSLAWPKAEREAYLARQRAAAGAATRERPAPQQITVERGKGHAALFIESILEGKPSRENATEGHAAAGAGHLANLAYRKGRKMTWDFATNKATPL